MSLTWEEFLGTKEAPPAHVNGHPFRPCSLSYSSSFTGANGHHWGSGSSNTTFFPDGTTITDKHDSERGCRECYSDDEYWCGLYWVIENKGLAEFRKSPYCFHELAVGEQHFPHAAPLLVVTRTVQIYSPGVDHKAVIDRPWCCNLYGVGANGLVIGHDGVVVGTAVSQGQRFVYDVAAARREEDQRRAIAAAAREAELAEQRRVLAEQKAAKDAALRLKEAKRTGCRHCGAQEHVTKDCSHTVCRNCQQPGHKTKDCVNVPCKLCGNVGHRRNTCPTRPPKGPRKAGANAPSSDSEGSDKE